MCPDPPQEFEAKPIPVVALGGSASAPEPLRAFLAALPPHSGAAFVIIQRPGPDREEVSAESLTPHTAMEIVPVRGCFS
jgi:two-component system CheB/CheR fusion protein